MIARIPNRPLFRRYPDTTVASAMPLCFTEALPLRVMRPECSCCERVRYAECHAMPVPAGSPLSRVVARRRHRLWRLAHRASARTFKHLGLSSWSHRWGTGATDEGGAPPVPDTAQLTSDWRDSMTPPAPPFCRLSPPKGLPQEHRRRRCRLRPQKHRRPRCRLRRVEPLGK